jgi:hypothetical protein
VISALLSSRSLNTSALASLSRAVINTDIPYCDKWVENVHLFLSHKRRRGQ